MTSPTRRSQPEPTDQLVTEVVLSIFRTNGLLIAWGDRLAAPLGLTSARWQMLGAIALSEQLLSAPALASAMGVTRQGAQKQLDLLVADGLVEKLPNPGHQRSPLYQLSSRGRSVYSRIDRQWKERARRFAERLPVKDLQATLRSLAGLAEQLDPLQHES